MRECAERTPVRHPGGRTRERPGGAPIVVLKLGGSILQGEAGLALGVEEVRREHAAGRAVVAVVSALHGVTERLLARARRLAAAPTARGLAALLATGETRAAALLALALEGAGVAARCVDPAQAGLRTRGPRLEAEPVALDTARLREALASGGSVVLPGFYGIARDGAPALLGRGGSDLSALFVARRLGAAECRLVKDTGGVFEADPRREPAARRYRSLDWSDAAALGGRVIQARALAYARAERLGFRVAGPGGGEGTRVGPYLTRLARAAAVSPAPVG